MSCWGEGEATTDTALSRQGLIARNKGVPLLLASNKTEIQHENDMQNECILYKAYC
jgi:hypothetical protein